MKPVVPGAPPASGSGLADRLASAAARGDDQAIEEAARKFEAFFVEQMLSEMRDTTKILGEGMFDSAATDTWTEQLDRAVADEMTAGQGLGLARMIVASVKERAGAVDPDSIGEVAAPSPVPLRRIPTAYRAAAPARVDGVRRSGWGWPLADGGRVSSHFGERRHPTLGTVREHHGLDVAAPKGTPVFAAADGVVTRAEEAGAYGLLVEVDHGDGIVTRYAHQSAIDVAVGDTVRQGDRIGAVGSTGRSTGPHLHLEVRVEGEPVDPVDFLGAE